MTERRVKGIKTVRIDNPAGRPEPFEDEQETGDKAAESLPPHEPPDAATPEVITPGSDWAPPRPGEPGAAGG
jgi:hypothetical protein